MKVLDILENELLSEMAALKDPQKVADLIKAGDMTGAVENTLSKSSGKPLKSVAGELRKDYGLSSEQLADYQAALKGARPTATKGPSAKTAEKKKKQNIDAAKGKQPVTKNAKSQAGTITKLEQKLKRTANAVQNDSSLSDEEKKSNRKALELLGQALQNTKRGIGTLPKDGGESSKEKLQKIARGKVTTAERDAIDKEAADNAQYSKEVADEFKKATGKDIKTELERLLNNGTIIMQDWKAMDAAAAKRKKEAEDAAIQKDIAAEDAKKIANFKNTPEEESKLKGAVKEADKARRLRTIKDIAEKRKKSLKEEIIGYSITD